MVRNRRRRIALGLLGISVLADPASAHVGSLGSVASGSIPFWFVALTGGGVIGVSFLFATLVTERGAIETVLSWRRRLPVPVTTVLRRLAALLGVFGLGFVVIVGLDGPPQALSNAAVLVVWAGWWAGYTMTVYAIGNSWQAINPWRTIAALIPGGRADYPSRLGVWPSVVGLLALVWIEVVSPVAEDPRLLAVVVMAYSVVTIAGAAVYGTDVWFGHVDPIARVFRYYGRMAPLQRTERGVELVLPGTGLTRSRADGIDEAAFVVALVWVTTYDGLVSTPLWATAIEPLVDVGVPPLLLYLLAVLAGFWFFFAAYRIASKYARVIAGSYVSVAFVRDWFAPSLVPIAAGYHVAHFLGYLLALSPALVAALVSPLSATAPPEVLVLPSWFGSLQLVFVLLGHVLAVWVAHTLAFELFPGRLQPIRSQYPFVAVMILYTMTSMWIVSQPTGPPPFV